MKKNKGFTLIELMVTISIVAVLMAVAIVYYGNTQKQARDNKRKADLEQVRSALEMYRSQEGEYPTTSDFSAMITTISDYINEAPEDPRPSTYEYYYSSGGDSYNLCAFFEGGGTDSCGDCEVGAGSTPCNYQVNNP